MKKIISLLCLLVLAACSNNNTPPAHDNTTPFYKYMTRLESEEILIRGAVKTPDNKTYLLSDKEDYEFSGVDAHYLQPLFQPEYMTKLLKSNRSNDKFYLMLGFDADRSFRIGLSLLSGYDNHPIRPAGAVKSSRSSILQNRQ